jgi:hypothetical protein
MADRYWILDGGNWSDTAHWSTTTGGVGGASVPTSADNVYFDANSFTAAGQTVTVDVIANCLDMDWTGALNMPALAGGNPLNVYGSPTYILLMTVNKLLALKATSMGKTITTNGLNFNSSGGFFFLSSSGGWTLQDDIIGSANLNLTYGTFNTNSKNISCSAFAASGTSIRSLLLGSSVITCSGTCNFTTTTGLTFDAGTSTIKITGNSKTFAGGGLTYNNVEFQGTPTTISGSNIFNDLKLTAGKTVNVTAGTTQTVTTMSGDGTAGNLITIQSTVAGSPFTISKASGIIEVAYYSIQDCIASGGATFFAIDSLNMSGNTGWFFSAYWLEISWDGTNAFTGTEDNCTMDSISVECRRGRDYASQLTGKVSPGRLTATMNNLTGKYSSFNASSPLYGSILPGRKVRLRTSTATIWTGYLGTIIPAGSLGGNPVVSLEASGPLSRIKKSITPPKQANQLTGTIMDAILDDAGWAAGDRAIDIGKTAVGQWYIDKIDAFEAMRQIEETELGFLTEGEDGKIIFEDRHHRLTGAHLVSQQTFTDTVGEAIGYNAITQQDPIREIYNDIMATVESYYTAPSSAVLWTLQETPTIAPGQTLIYWAEYPNSEHDSSTGAFVDTWDTPAVGTDITQTGVANGDIAVTVSKFAKAMKINITNNNVTTSATLTLVQAQGIKVTKLSSTSVSSSDSASQASYGAKSYTLPAKWLQTTTLAQDYAGYIIGRYKDPVPVISISFMANKNTDLMTEALTRNISDRVTVVATGAKTELGINNEFFIEAISHRISNSGKFHEVTFELSDASGDGGYWVLGTSELGTNTRLAY